MQGRSIIMVAMQNLQG